MPASYPVPALSDGTLIDAAGEWNPHVDALNDLNTRAAALEALTTNTSGAVGIGNQRLSDRLGAGVTNAATADARFGSGVGTGSNVTTGSAASQLGDLRSRATTLEGYATGGHADRQAAATLNFGTSEVTVLYGTANETDTGVSYSAGTFTFSKAGRWVITANSALSVVTANLIGYAQKIYHNGTAKAVGISVAPTTGFGASASTAKRIKVANTDTMYVAVVASAAGQQVQTGAVTSITLDYVGP